jgi:hypothetical protein
MTLKTPATIKTEISGSTAGPLLGGTILDDMVDSFVPVGGSSTPTILTTDITIYTSLDGLYLLSTGQLTGIGGITYGVNGNIAAEFLPGSFPNNVMISWNFPSQSNQFDFGVRTYPHLVATVPGPFFPFFVPFKAVNTFTNIEITFDYTLNGDMTNDVLIDMFLNNSPVPGGTREIELFARQPQSLLLRNAGLPYRTIDTALPDHGRYDVVNASSTILQVYPVFYDANPAADTYGTNPTLSGGAAGSPGSSPTNCSFAGGTSITGLTRTLATGTTTDVDGNTVNYWDVNFTGTPGSTGNLTFSFEIGLPCNHFEQWFTSIYLALVGGSLTNIGTISLNITGYQDNTNNFSGDTFGNSIPAINASLTATVQKFALQARMAKVNTNLIIPNINIPVTSGQAINFTLRVGNPLFIPEGGTPRTTASHLAYSPPAYSRTITSGRIDILAMLNALVADGFMVGTETFAALQIGPEIVSGNGSMYFNKFSAVVG